MNKDANEVSGNGKDETAEKLDHIDDGIEAINEQLAEIQERLDELETPYAPGYSTYDSASILKHDLDMGIFGG